MYCNRIQSYNINGGKTNDFVGVAVLQHIAAYCITICSKSKEATAKISYAVAVLGIEADRPRL